ncbi:MAG TPA: RNA polymerase sigma factor [Planctomycetes bacterium]|nr:RNA polymerase sigma factor [Planctomycetota bacterium]
MLEDKLLILRFKHGSGDALCRIYQKYRIYLLRIATALLNDTALAEDVVHDVFLRFALSAKRIKLKGSLKAYLRACVVNDVRSRARAAKRYSCLGLDEIEPAAVTENESEHWIILEEQSKRISGALVQLSFEQREAVVLRLNGGMKFREIADLQNVSVKTIQSRYRYGLNKLRSILNSEVEK